MSATPANSVPRRLRTAAFFVLGALLIWLVVTRSFAAALATSYPSIALVLQPAEPRASLALAKKELAQLLSADRQAGTPGQGAEPVESADRMSALSRLAEAALLDRATTSARPNAPVLSNANPLQLPKSKSDLVQDIARHAALTLAGDPLNAAAVGALAQVREIQGSGNTRALMQAAARLSVRESYAQYWLLLDARKNNDWVAVLRYADLLLRSRPRTLPLMLPHFASVAEKSDATQKLNELLSQNPPWRPAVLARLPSAVTDARTPLYALLALQSSPNPPNQQEISNYISFLVGKNFHELAYYTWLQFLPPDRLASLNPLQNGGFEWPLTGSVFDWTLSPGAGAGTEIRPRPDVDEGKALFVEFTEGRAEFPGVHQTVLLAPGTYSLKGQYKGQLIGQRGLVWRVSCLGKNILVGQTEMLRGDVPQWRTFDLKFAVPDDGCRAQQIRLALDARSASEQFVTGVMWFDDVGVTRNR